MSASAEPSEPAIGGARGGDAGARRASPPVGATILLLLSVAAGVGVANLYYAQPLGAQMAASLGRSESAVGLALTATQVGYALGMVLLVPIGDGRERRGVIVATALGTALALLLVAAAPTFGVLVAASLLLGFASSLPQMIVPFAVGLVPLEERGKAIGSVMSGLLTGILLSRVASGAFAGAFGWRTTFVAAAGLMTALAVVLRAALPRQMPPQPLRWSTIVRSLGAIARSEPILRRHALLGALSFASFSAFWLILSFRLASFGYGSRMAGLFGAIGVVGVAVASVVGRVAGKVRATAINAACLLLIVVAFAVLAIAGRSLVLMATGAVLLDAGVQGNQLANQHVVFGLRPEIRNRLNAVYMVVYFVGGGLGSALGALAWGASGWSAVCAIGAATALTGALFAVFARSPRPDRS